MVKLEDLSSELRETLLQSGKKRVFKINEEIFSEGDKASILPIVLRGSIRMMRYLEPGKEVTIGIFRSGEMFALPPVCDGKCYPAGAIAMEQSELLLIPREKFLDILRSSNELAFAVIQWMCEMLREKTAIIQNLASSSPEFRIASLLIKLAEEASANMPVRITLRREDLAKMTGLTTETTIRTVRKLAARKLFLIDHGKIVIDSPHALKHFVNG